MESLEKEIHRLGDKWCDDFEKIVDEKCQMMTSTFATFVHLQTTAPKGSEEQVHF